MKHREPLRLATRHNGRRDGELVLVDADLQHVAAVPHIAPTLQAALDDWTTLAPELQTAQQAWAARQWQGADPYQAERLMAPLPRAYHWADASVYRQHAKLMYQWRNEPIPSSYEREPLVYQGGSDVMLSGHEPIVASDEAHGIDLEAEIAVITTDIPMGSTVAQALDGIALVVLLNDVSLRGLIPSELAKGFGFYQSKPATSFAPVAVTPAALGSAWQDAMLHLPVDISVNGERLGAPHAAEDTVFHFGQILSYLTRTRSMAAGSIVGAGTISNADPAAGSACITEARVRQMLAGQPPEQLRPYLRHGDRVRLEVRNAQGQSVFGLIDQPVQVQARQSTSYTS